MSDLVAAVGKNPAMIMTYASFDDEFNTNFAASASTYNAIPMISWLPYGLGSNQWANGDGYNWNPHYTPQNIIAGVFDAYLNRYAIAVGQFNKPIYIRFAEEMNGGWLPWSYGTADSLTTGHRTWAVTTDDYNNMWKHVVNIFRQNHVTNVHWVWSPNIQQNLNLLSALYPGDDYVDWMALDGYNWGPVDQWHTFVSFYNLFIDSYNAIIQVSQKPLMIPEMACTENGGDKGAWIKQSFLVDILSFPKIRLIGWFSENKEQDWRINSSPGSLSAFSYVAQKAFSSSMNF